MNRASKYFDLTFVVQCDSRGMNTFETIAAFNSDTVASHYARDCLKTNPYNRYRVMGRKGDRWYVVAGAV